MNLKIDGLKIYLPQTAISEGASSADGFSTMLRMLTSLSISLLSPGSITPYL